MYEQQRTAKSSDGRVKDAVAAARSLSFQRSSPQIFGKKRDRSQSKAGWGKRQGAGGPPGVLVFYFGSSNFI